MTAKTNRHREISLRLDSRNSMSVIALKSDEIQGTTQVHLRNFASYSIIKIALSKIIFCLTYSTRNTDMQ